MSGQYSCEKRIRVAILEDLRLDRQSIEKDLSLAEDIEVIASSEDPETIIRAVQEYQPDVAIVDLRIRDDDSVGLSVLKEIRATSPRVRCIVLSGRLNLERFIECARAGAYSIVQKVTANYWQLADLVRITAVDDGYYDPNLVREMLPYISRTRLLIHSTTSEAERNPLTDREMDVLLALNKGMSNEEIAKTLVVSIHTVKKHVDQIKSKLGARDRHHAVLIAIGRGLLRGCPTLAPKK